MTESRLPAVLTFKPPQNGISVYRALKNAKDLLEMLAAMADSTSNTNPLETMDRDRIEAAIDDLGLMMGAVE